MNVVLLLMMFLTSPSLLSAGRMFEVLPGLRRDYCPRSCNKLELVNQVTDLKNRLSGLTTELNSLTSKVVISCNATNEDESVDKTSCTNVFDGATGSRWFLNELNPWVQLFLEKPERLTSLVIIQPYNSARIKDILIEFSDNSNQTVTLLDSKNGYISDKISLVPVVTSWVKLTYLSIYSYKGTDAAFAEITCY